MTNDPYVYDQMGIVVNYLDKSPESFTNIIPHIKNVFQNRKSVTDATENYFEYAMNSGWEFFRSTLPAIRNVGSNFIGSGIFKSMFNLYAFYDYDKNKLRTGLLNNGFLEHICKIDPQKTLHLFDLALAAGVAKAKDREVFAKTMELLKGFTSEELKKVSHYLVDYMDKRELYAKDSKEMMESRIGLFGAVSGYIKSPEQTIKFKEISELTLKINQKNKLEGALNLSSNVIHGATKLSPQIGHIFKYSEQIKKIITLYEDCKMAKEVKNEFIEASKEMFKGKSFIAKTQLAILQTMKETNPKHDKVVRQKIYDATLDLMQSISPDIKEINDKIRGDRGGFEVAIDDLLKENSSINHFRKAKDLGLDGKKIVEFLEKITSPKGNKAVTRYLDSPTNINFGKIFIEGGLVQWAAGRAVAMCKNSPAVVKLKEAMGGVKSRAKSVVYPSHTSRSM